MIEYVSIGSLFVNNINFEDGYQKRYVMGGGGFFAFAGLLQYTANAALISEVGNDLDVFFIDWADRNNIKDDGFIPYDNPTILSTLTYLGGGYWEETFQYGPNNLGFVPSYKDDEKLKILERFVEQGNLKGLYLAIPISNAEFLERVYQLKKIKDFRIMLELIPDDCVSENLTDIKNKLLVHTDLFSLNHHESYKLFSVSSQEEAIEEIIKIGMPCFYRVGERGSYFIENNNAFFMPSAFHIVGDNEVDPTGCGNSSTAASLWAVCEGYREEDICAIANTAAAYNVQQFGPYPDFNEETRRKSLEQALAFASKIKERKRRN